jgi:hypothetical protein
MDVAPYAPKGNNSQSGDQMHDVNNTAIRFDRTDIAGATATGRAGQNHRAFTGAAWIGSVSTPAVEHTTHNGQLSGIVDVNGNQWDITPGLTCVGGGAGDFRLFPTSGDWTATSSNTSITGAAGVLSLAAETAPGDDDGVWWAEALVNSYYLAPDADGTFHPSSGFSDATLRAMTECLLPRELGTSGTQTSTNIFGGDRFGNRRLNNMLPHVGGYWGSSADAGVFSVPLTVSATTASERFGARAVRLLSA